MARYRIIITETVTFEVEIDTRRSPVRSVDALSDAEYTALCDAAEHEHLAGDSALIGVSDRLAEVTARAREIVTATVEDARLCAPALIPPRPGAPPVRSSPPTRRSRRPVFFSSNADRVGADQFPPHPAGHA